MSRYQVGQTAFFEKKILEEHIIQFATVTEDNNTIHLDEEFAKKSIFKTRVSFQQYLEPSSREMDVFT